MGSKAQRLGLSIVGLTSISLLATGCGNSSAPTTSSSKGPVNITYWAGHSSGALYKTVVAEVKRFNATHSNIHVTFKPTGATHHGLAAFESGQSPNVGMISGYIVPQLVQAGALVKLNSYIQGAHGLSSAQIKKLYYPVVWKDMSEGVKGQYMMPLEKKSLLVIYYNKSLFKKAGIKQLPHTWSQVNQDVAAITKLGSNYHGIAWTPSLTQFFDMTMANGGKVFSSHTHRKEFSLDNAGAKAALGMLRHWVQTGEMVLTSGYNYQLDFGTGNVGMLIDASAGYSYDKSSVGGKFVMGGIPSPDGTSGHSSQGINGESLAMFNTGTSAQKKASWTFIKWMSSPPTNVYWDEHTNYLPLGPQETSTLKSFYAQHPAQAASFSNPQGWWFKPRTANYAAARTAVKAIYEKALRGQITVTQALIQMDRVGTSYLSGNTRG